MCSLVCMVHHVSGDEGDGGVRCVKTGTILIRKRPTLRSSKLQYSPFVLYSLMSTRTELTLERANERNSLTYSLTHLLTHSQP